MIIPRLNTQKEIRFLIQPDLNFALLLLLQLKSHHKPYTLIHINSILPISIQLIRPYPTTLANVAVYAIALSILTCTMEITAVLACITV